jgi:hypothetical protein
MHLWPINFSVYLDIIAQTEIIITYNLRELKERRVENKLYLLIM